MLNKEVIMKMDLTKTLAHKSGKKPKTVIGIWALVFIVSLVLIGSMLGDAMSTEESSSLNPKYAGSSKISFYGPRRYM